MRLLITADWELTGERLPIANKVIEAIREEFNKGGYDHFVFAGDMFREFTARTVAFVNDAIETINGMSRGSILVVGNHDREISIDRLTAIFGNSGVFAMPQITEIGEIPIGILPAPDRAAFGASRGAEGRRQRDAALSEALEAALISLETQIGLENLSKAILFFHAAIGGAELGTQKLPHGLTWEIPAARLQRWGLAIGGHIHRPQQIGENIYYTGGIAPWTFSDKAERFRVLSVEVVGEGFEVKSIDLPRVLVPIELELDQEGLHIDGRDPYIIGESLAGHLLNILTHRCNVSFDDNVVLKLKAKLPPNELDALPKAEELKAAINKHNGSELIKTLTICREPTGLHKTRISEDAREMSLSELFEQWRIATGNKFATEVLERAKATLPDIENEYSQGEGNFGFSPVKIVLKNFRQWEDAELDFSKLEGSISITGDNALGKSNLIEAVLFALFKRSPSSTQSIEDELRLGAANGSVELAFNTNGRNYLIRRAMERGKGGVTCKSELFENVSPKQDLEPVCETAADIDKKIAELVGSYDFVISTFFGTQKEIDRLVDATPAQWHKLLLEALALERFEPLRKHCDKKAESFNDLAKEREIKIDELEQQITVDEEELGDFRDAKEFEEDIRMRNEGVGDTSRIIGQLEKEKAELVEQKAALHAKQREQEALRIRFSSINRRIKEIVIDPIGEKPEAPEMIDEAVAKIKIEGLEKRRDAANDLMQKAITDISRIDGEITALDKKIENDQRYHENRELEIATLEKKLEELEQPPCAVFGKDALGSAEMKDQCPAWKAWSKGDHLVELKELQIVLASEIDNSSAILKALSLKKEKLNKNRVSLEVDFGNANFQIKELQDKLGDYQNKLRAVELWESKAAAQEGLKKQKAALEAESLEIAGKLKSAENVTDMTTKVTDDISDIDNRIQGNKDIMTAQREKIRELESMLDKIKNLREGLDKKRAKQETYRSEIASQKIDASAWLMLALAFHHTGIPYLLMERMVGAFEHETNELLAPTDLSITIETVTPTKKGEARDRVGIKFNDPRGQHPLAKASGYQRAALGMSLRASMAAVGARFWGSVPEIYVQDEGWERFHSSKHDIARELIGSLAQRFSRFFYITHVESLADSADIRIQVVGVNGTSKVIQ